MGSMLGLVLSDNVIVLFVFWELTGFTSYLLIGFEHDRPEARRAATQALLVTGGGGLALLAAGILMVEAAGTPLLSDLMSRGGLAGHPLYVGIVALVLLAAFTKSAQFPFPLLAAERDAGAHTGERVSALRDDGEGGRLPRRAHDADPRRRRRSGPAPSRWSLQSRWSSGRTARCSRPISSASSRTPRSARSGS